MSVKKDSKKNNADTTEVLKKKNKKVKKAAENQEDSPELKKVKVAANPEEAEIEAESPPTKKENKKKTKKVDENGKPVKDKKAKNLSEKIDQKKQALKDKLIKKPETAEEKAEKKEKKKKITDERKKKKKDDGVYDIGTQAKKVWEQVRREDCPAGEKTKLLNELHQLVKGNVSKIIYAHDTVRVIECLMALGDESIRDALFEELKDELIKLAKSKYAHFFVEKLVKYGTKPQRDVVFKTLEGRVAELAKHKIANNLVETCYNEYCNAAQRNRFLQEFFGPEFRHFKEEDSRTVVQLMLKHPEKRRDILKHLATHVNPLITKGCYNISLVHTVLYNYMLALNNQLEAVPAERERREKERAEYITSLRDVCLHICHSHDGARLVMNVIWYGTAKDRKHVIKTFKKFMVKTATDEHGYMAILAMLDTVDDTKITGKAILGEILTCDEGLEEIISNERARKVLTFGLVGRNKTYFHPDVIANLAKGDGHSKKDPEVRRKEVAESIVEPLCQYIMANLETFLGENNLIMFMKALFEGAPEGNAQVIKLLDQLAKKIAQPFTLGDGQNLIESAGVHMFTKKILGKESFYQKILDNFDPKTIQDCLKCNRGAFLLVAMTELNKDGLQAVKHALKPHMPFLKEQNNKGVSILLEKIQ